MWPVKGAAGRSPRTQSSRSRTPRCQAAFIQFGTPSPGTRRVRRIHGFGQVEGDQATRRTVADLADLLVGAGVVVAGADEPAAVLVVERDLVAGTGQPGENAAGFAELVAVVRGHSRWCRGSLGVCVAFGDDVLREGGRPGARDSVIGDGRVPDSAHAQARAARPSSPVSRRLCVRTASTCWLGLMMAGGSGSGTRMEATTLTVFLARRIIQPLLRVGVQGHRSLLPRRTSGRGRLAQCRLPPAGEPHCARGEPALARQGWVTVRRPSRASEGPPARPAATGWLSVLPDPPQFGGDLSVRRVRSEAERGQPVVVQAGRQVPAAGADDHGGYLGVMR